MQFIHTSTIVSKHFPHSLKSIIWVIFLLGNPLSLLAHEEFSAVREIIEDYPHILKCDTACHKSKNIILAKKNKTMRPECQNCHVGIDMPPISPFSSYNDVFLTQGFGSVLKPDQKFKPLKNTNNTTLQNIAQTIITKAGKKTVEKIDPMVLIKGGEFIMGSNERWDDEAPEYIESVDEFYIDLYEVTNADYKKFTSATQRETPYHWASGKIPQNKENHPVIYVSWYDADEYCKWLGKRLPNEQEWEKAARGENGNIYPWGNFWTTDRSNHPYKGSTGTEPVGSYLSGRSPYGLYDMSGNVWEWVDSYYLPHPGNTITRGEYGKDKRVLKGGSWFDCLSYGCGLSAPTFNRSFFTPQVKNNSFGFRCAKSS